MRPILLALILAAPAAAQAPAPLPAAIRSRIDRVVTDAMKGQHIPGIALAVTRAGRVVYSKGYGLANVELSVPVTPTTVFKIGSVSKQFIATGIMVLAQEGKLSIDDPVSAHVPGTPSAWAPVTLRHLLSHTSGIVREGPAFAELKVQPDSVVIQSGFGEALLFPTGTSWAYCNLCYFTLADIVRRESGLPWPEFIRNRVFLASGMRDTRTTTTTELVPRRASGYEWKDGSYVPAMEYLALRPSGAFLSTVLDLARWDSVLTTEGVLRTATKDAMWTRTKLANGNPAAVDSAGTVGYGLGWFLDQVNGHRRIQHGGALPGFRAQLSRYPDDRLGVILLTNGNDARPDQIETAIATILLSARRP